jgi:2-oxoisovalerate dehydrogenase E1 component beta subunit
MTWDQGLHKGMTSVSEAPAADTREMTYLEAIRDALQYELRRDEWSC